MKSVTELFNEHLNRIKDVVALKKADRPPIVFNADAFCLKYAGGKLSDLVTNVEYGNEMILKGMQALGDIDSIERAGFYPPMLGTVFLSKVKVPGRELPDDQIWQIDELDMMTEEDYDTIIDKGWNYYFLEYSKKYTPEGLKEMEYFMPLAPKITQRFIDAGIVPLCGDVVAGAGYETLAAGRGIANLMLDLHRIPDKVLAAIEVMAAESEKSLKEQLRATKPLAVFAGGARSAGDILSYKMFDKFMWPFFKKLVEIIVEEGSIVYLHLDSCWDRFLDYFLELPKGKCIFSLDSTTDIFKAGEVLKGHMCFMGDVAPSLLTLGTPDEVYAYSKRLIDEFTPKGFIMSSGCSIPSNAKPENVKAMIAAATGK
jgi:Uroporphyrinogen decarboxylase (URO-D)